MKPGPILNFNLFSKCAVACLFLISIESCNKEYDPVPDWLDNIFPLKTGQIRNYAVQDTNYASALGREGRSYFERETVNGTETDLSGKDLTTLWIYESPDSLDSLGNRIFSWTFDHLWSMYLGEVYAERTEGNTRYLVLKVPPMEGTKWNGNLYNSLGARTYEVITHDTTVTTQGITYNHCVFILKAPFSVTPSNNTVYYRREYAYEIYAPDVGLIVRHDEQVVVQHPDQGYNPSPEESWYLHEELISHN